MVNISRAHSSTLQDAQRPGAVYNGGYSEANRVCLRIGNGGAGQSGLIGALANAFIQYCVKEKDASPFLVAWYLTDTTQSLQALSSRTVDVALTYNEAAEQQVMNSGAAVRRHIVFLDHFYLVGPPSNPANLSPLNDTVLGMFSKIAVQAEYDSRIPPAPSRPTTRFLSRFDKSATNIKESELFIKIGQVPWAFAYSTWYHQYARFPLEALKAASLLEEYSLTDRGTWLSSPSSVRESLVVYKKGEEDSKTDAFLLLNPCAALLGRETLDKRIAELFMDWLLKDEGGQKVIINFKKNGEQLYSPRPKLDIRPVH